MIDVNSLDIKKRQMGSVTVLDIEGNIRISDGCVALRAVISRLLDEGQNQVLLNLAGVTYVDSSGLGEFNASYIVLKKNGGRLKFLHAAHRVRELFVLTKLLTGFEVYESESVAVESFAQSRLQPEVTRLPFVRELHHRPEDDDTGLPESPIYSNYSDQLWKSHTRHGLTRSPNRS